MFDAASPGVFPSLAEIRHMAKAHILQRLGKKTKRNLNDSSFFHLFTTIPLVSKKRIYNLISFFL